LGGVEEVVRLSWGAASERAGVFSSGRKLTFSATMRR
jgi:hypothetical protein